MNLEKRSQKEDPAAQLTLYQSVRDLSLYMDGCFHRRSDFSSGIAMRKYTQHTLLQKAIVADHEYYLLPSVHTVETEEAFRRRLKADPSAQPCGYSLHTPVNQDEPYHVSSKSGEHCFCVKNVEKLGFTKLTAVYMGQISGMFVKNDHTKKSYRKLHHFVLLPIERMTKDAYEKQIASLPWAECKMEANSEEIAFYHLDTKMYGVPDNETPEFYFYNMMNEMIDDADMPFDVRVELSATAHYMNETKADLQNVLRKSDLAWRIYKAATSTSIFNHSDAHLSALHEVVDTIRELYPGWPVLHTTEEKKALKQGTTNFMGARELTRMRSCQMHPSHS